MATRGSAAWMRLHYGVPCKQDMVPVKMFGRDVYVHKDAARAFKRLDRVFKIHAYRYWKHLKSQKDIGAYNCRVIAGTTTYSNHSWATAVDIDWQENGYGVDAFNCPMWKRARRAVRKLEKEGLFRWGGRYRTPDPMHFEVMKTPAEIRNSVTKTGTRKIVSSGK